MLISIYFSIFVLQQYLINETNLKQYNTTRHRKSSLIRVLLHLCSGSYMYMKSGIYTITNVIDNKKYVGMAVDVCTRLRKHKENLRSKKHANQYLQAAWNKYGESSFLFELLENYDDSFLPSMEHFWAILLDTHNEKYGYNMRPTHPYNSPRLSKETKQKISIANKGKKMSLESIEKTAKAHRGVPLSMETRRKISEANKGKIISTEAKEKMSIAQKGKKRAKEAIEKAKVTKAKNGTNRITAETIEKIKATKSKNGPAKWSEESRKAAAERMRGCKWTEEAKKKASEGMKGRKQRLGCKQSEEEKAKRSISIKKAREKYKDQWNKNDRK